MQSESEFEHSAAVSRFAAKHLSEIFHTYIAFRKVMITL